MLLSSLSMLVLNESNKNIFSSPLSLSGPSLPGNVGQTPKTFLGSFSLLRVKLSCERLELVWTSVLQFVDFSSSSALRCSSDCSLTFIFPFGGHWVWGEGHWAFLNTAQDGLQTLAHPDLFCGLFSVFSLKLFQVLKKKQPCESNILFIWTFCS